MTLDRILSQDEAIERIKTDIKEKKVDGAYLFAGPSGVGKKRTAISFAMALNCKQDNLNGCGVCTSCVKIQKGIHPSFRIIEPEGGSIKIEQIRHLKVEAGYKIYEGKKRIWVIDEAHKLTHEAANSLLKIIEEPPPQHVIILVSYSPASLLPTIVSRCRIIKFSPLRQEVIKNFLREKGFAEEKLLDVVSRIARGSAGKALEIAGKKSFLEERNRVFKLIKEGSLSALEVFRIAEEWAGKKNSDSEILLDVILFFLRDIMMLKMGYFSILNKDKEEELKNLKDKYTLSHLIECMQAVEESRSLIRANVSIQLVIETLLMKVLFGKLS